MADAHVIARDLTKRYSGPESVVAIERLNLSIAARERVAIVGKSGSGKSTLLNLLAGLDRPTSGELTIAGKALHSLDATQMAAYRLRTVGVVFQSFQLIPQHTAMQNVALPLVLAGEAVRSRQALAREWLVRVGLERRLSHHPYMLSGGEQQRVAIARALVNSPSVVLADEPTGNLDAKTADEIVELLATLCSDNGATLIAVTHDEDVAKRLCQRKVLMDDGHLSEAPEHAST